MIKILIADDHSVVRRGIKQILSEESDIEVLGEASSTDEVIEQLDEQDWDILVLDITMPGRSGLECLLEVRHKKPEMKVLILSMHPEEEIAITALRTGASGYLNKDSVPEELIKAIRKIHEGGRYISSTLAESILYSMDKGSSQEPHETLSEREFQVFCQLSSGKTLTEIAEELSLSIKTISTYRSRILEKMNLKTNVDLTHYAIKHKLVLNKV
jgi:two-component system, NarL family, invasion response regulator UvrY